MANLIAKPAVAETDCSQVIGDVSLSMVQPDHISWVHLGSQHPQVFKGISGVAFPAPNRATGKAGARAVWFANRQALWVGAPLGPVTGIAPVDQTDAWAMLRLDGVHARQVLARLSPIDLRETAFKRGHTARSLIGHMAGSITCVGAEAFEIMVFRSMAQTAVHDLKRAMRQVAAVTPGV